MTHDIFLIMKQNSTAARQGFTLGKMNNPQIHDFFWRRRNSSGNLFKQSLLTLVGHKSKHESYEQNRYTPRYNILVYFSIALEMTSK